MVTYAVKLIKKKEIAHNTWAFSFEKPSGFTFLPGQFTTVIAQLPSGKTDSRDMTIASSPLDESLCIVTKINEKRSAFKQSLVALPIRGEVAVTRPAGGFVIREEEKPHVFLAGGIGITPFYSMLMFTSKKNIPTPFLLFVSFSSKEEVIYCEELKQLERSNLTVVYSVTNPPHEWEGEAGRISEKMIGKYLQDITNTIFMIAGPVEMVDDMQAMLLGMGIPSSNIRIDYFTGY